MEGLKNVEIVVFTTHSANRCSCSVGEIGKGCKSLKSSASSVFGRAIGSVVCGRLFHRVGNPDFDHLKDFKDGCESTLLPRAQRLW